MTECILAGDIGGTKTIVASYVQDCGPLERVREVTYASRDYPGLEPILEAFLSSGQEVPRAAAFGIAGPVLDGKVDGTNLPWTTVEQESVARTLGIAPERTRLLNDLEAAAYGALFLGEDEKLIVQPGLERDGNISVIAAGTGLGQAFLFWDGERHQPSATEGGHAAFAPRDAREDGLLTFLRDRHGHVSYERVVSGPGLKNLFDYLREVEERPVEKVVLDRFQREDPAQVIGEAGVHGACPTCEDAVDWFVSLYGYQAQNQALTVLALGGVYVAGGIVVKLLPKVKRGIFLRAFTDHPVAGALLARMPVRVILNPRTSLSGAAHVARELL